VLAVERRFDDLHRQLRQDTAQKATDAIAKVLQTDLTEQA